MEYKDVYMNSLTVYCCCKPFVDDFHPRTSPANINAPSVINTYIYMFILAQRKTFNIVETIFNNNSFSFE